jgi:3-oxoacyl-[acyl-carrier-protein] synthase II
MTMPARDLARVVVTGLGAVTPIGIGREELWQAALAGRSGAGPITQYDAADDVVRIACEVKGFDPGDFGIDRRSARRMERFSQLAVAASQLALDDAALTIEGDGERVGAIIGCGVGGLDMFTEQVQVMLERGRDRLSPLFIPTMVANMAAGQTSMRLGLRGPLVCTTTACASANHAIGDAADQIRMGRADVMLAGGTESGVTPLGVGAFAAMRALSTRNDDPERASRPFDAERDGFVFGEAGAVLVLERLEHAVSRGAEPYCEVVGYGLTADAHHLTENDPTGISPGRAIRMALEEAGRDGGEVDYINAHATATPVGDPNEVKAIIWALGEAAAAATAVSSTKSMHGHCLGAAGGVETGLTALAIRNGRIPPTINLDRLDPACTGIDHVIGAPRDADVGLALSNAFGFGGHNAVIALARYED